MRRPFIDCRLSMGGPLLASRHERGKIALRPDSWAAPPSVAGGAARDGRLAGTYTRAITASISTCAPFGSALT